jgi:hypothetical protein
MCSQNTQKREVSEEDLRRERVLSAFHLFDVNNFRSARVSGFVIGAKLCVQMRRVIVLIAVYYINLSVLNLIC